MPLRCAGIFNDLFVENVFAERVSEKQVRKVLWTRKCPLAYLLYYSPACA